MAELVMITDLLRSDIGQVCEFGSVEVAEMLRLETLAQVHHLVYQVGAGIVADSDPDKEYEETLHKATGIRLAIARWQS
jgi:anthranilate/para-aminobenzoate synthase component I